MIYNHDILCLFLHFIFLFSQVIKRRKYSHTPQTYNLNLQGYKDVGIVFEPGIYISKINHGSSAAQQHNLAVGDRVVAVSIKLNVESSDLLNLSTSQTM